MAHAISALRGVLAIPFAWALLQDTQLSARIAACLFVVAVASDLLDGCVARWRNTSSARGRALDHGSDFAFVLAALCAASARGLVSWFLPALVALAFVQYAVDSYLLHRQRALRMSELGRWNGILYFVPVGGVILVDLGMDRLEPLIAPLAWLLVVSTLASIADRLLALGCRRTVLDLPGAETEDRWMR